MKSIQRLLGVFFLFTFLCLIPVSKVDAAEEEKNISVTVPTEVKIVFSEDGTNSVSNFSVHNDSLVPIQVTNMKIQEYNGWQLVSEGTIISADCKQMVFRINDQVLSSGDNFVQINIPEKSQKRLSMGIRRGAWTNSYGIEKAFGIEVQYEVGTKAFSLTFHGNGSDVAVESVMANNGETINLPIPTKKRYSFKGWKDAEGNIYHTQYVMPIGGGNLEAQWVFTTAYAFYSSDDQSLTFVRSEEPISVGQSYQGKTVTSVYTGIENSVYSEFNQIPWIWANGEFGTGIKKVMVEDVIQPIGTAYWFFCLTECSYFDLSKLDVSQVTDMTSMFSDAGYNVITSVTLKGIKEWDVSNVRYMSSTFRGLASQAKMLYWEDISGWNANWNLDCRGWNVDKVTSYSMFNYNATDKVIPPNWKY